jgi:hypothetical protein
LRRLSAVPLGVSSRKLDLHNPLLGTGPVPTPHPHALDKGLTL